MYLILLLVVFTAFGVFAVQNNGTQDFAFLGTMWHLPAWAPTAIGTIAMAVLLVLHMSHMDLGARFREFGHSRALDEHRGRIEDLRDENARLREELAAARGQVRTAPGALRPQSWRDGIRSLASRFRGRETA
jgi:hypothetical protein